LFRSGAVRFYNIIAWLGFEESDPAGRNFIGDEYLRHGGDV
jgi:hypothetical protein